MTTIVMSQEERQAAVDEVLSTHVPLGRSEPHLGSLYADVVMPAMPALPLSPDITPLTHTATNNTGSGSSTSSNSKSGSSDDDLWPPELSSLPLMKTPVEASRKYPSSLKGVASGVRSALVRVRGSWYRLKGSGNNDEGFPAEV